MRFTWANIYPSEAFWSRILVWRAIAFVNFTRWIGLCMFVLFKSMDFGGFMSWNTQPNLPCVRWSTSSRSSFQLEITFLTRSPWSIVTIVDNKFPYAFVPITFLQHSYCTFVIILFEPFSRLFINLTVCIWALLPKPTTTLGHVVQAIWRVPFFTKWVIASSSKVILAKPSRHSTTGTFLWDFGFSMIFAHSAPWKNSETDLMV